MNNSSMGSSMLKSFSQSSHLHNTTFNSSFNTSGMSFSRRGGRGAGDGTVIMSVGLSQTVEPYGVALPAMVKVALSSFTGDNHQYSCRLDPNGWGWLVTGRKLYVWRHNQEASKKSTIVCRELVLPPSELVHNARLICVLPTATGSLSTAPSCLAVSPEGHITFWPNISNESTTVTINADIPGQECDSLTSIWPVGCILTTTSSTVLLIKPVPGRGNKPGMTCVTLGVQKGWLGGFSKKVSTMLFTPMPSASTGLDSKRAKVVVPMSKEDDQMLPGNNREGKLYIFQGSVVQIWQIKSDSHVCNTEFSIDENLRRQFLENVWATDEDNRTDLRGIQAWILDVAIIPHSKELAVFAAAKSQYETTENLVYGIVILDPKRYRQRDSWQFIPVVCGIGSAVFEDEQLYSWKLYTAQNHFFVVSQDSILTASERTDAPADSIESSQLGGPIIGAGNVSVNTVCILVPKAGLLSIRPTPVGQDGLGLDETFTDIRVPDHLALSMTHANLADILGSEDQVNRYKTAFIVFLQKKHEESMNILTNLFPPNGPSLAPHDPLDLTTVTICEKLIDEAPVADPRWAASFIRTEEQDPLGMKSKILIKNFLIDKRESLELFFGFLNNTGIWPRLVGVIVREDAIATGSLLYNSYEKIYFALSLQNMQSESHFRKVLDTAIKSIVMMRREKESQTRSAHLSSNDLFYKEVSRVHQIIPALVAIQEEDFNNLLTKDIPSRISLTNEVILRSLLEVNAVANSIQPGEKLSQIHDFLIKPLMLAEYNQYEVISWVVQSNVLTALLKQQDIIVNNGVKNIEVDVGVKLDLLKHLQQYTDLILDGLKLNLDSIQSSERYQQKLTKFVSLRGNLLRMHLEVDDYEGAALLAEKYLDFEILCTICYDKQDKPRLEAYFEKYVTMNFPEFTFEWYVKQQKSAELVETFSNTRFRGKLSKFLERYSQIGWHHAALTDDFPTCANILKGLAEKEEMYADDKKFMLCMSKLAAMASGNLSGEVAPEQIQFVDEVDKSLRLIEFQNRLSDDILSSYALERETMRVLTPSEMIDMYTTDEVEFDPENFTNALGLAEFMINEELQVEKRLLIVYRAIKRDPWDEWPTDHPADVITVSALYHFLIAALEKGWTVNDVYPLPKLLSFNEIRSLMENPNAKFLLRACHEYITTTVANNSQLDSE